MCKNRIYKVLYIRKTPFEIDQFSFSKYKALFFFTYVSNVYLFVEMFKLCSNKTTFDIIFFYREILRFSY